MSSDLKPCPNPECEDDPRSLETERLSDRSWRVYCLACGMAGPVGSTEEVAGEFWNALHRPSTGEGGVEAVLEIVETVRCEAVAYDTSENQAGESACKEIASRLGAYFENLPGPAHSEMEGALRGCVEHMEWSTPQGKAAYEAACKILEGRPWP